MKTRTPTPKPNPPRPAISNPAWATEWGWHYRTLWALRDHLRGGTGDREREPGEPMESPSLHAEDFADECYDRDLARKLPADTATALHEVEAALDRFKAGTYGRCEKTGSPISKSLLRAQPWRRWAEDAP